MLQREDLLQAELDDEGHALWGSQVSLVSRATVDSLLTILCRHPRHSPTARATPSHFTPTVHISQLHQHPLHCVLMRGTCTAKQPAMRRYGDQRATHDCCASTCRSTTRLHPNFRTANAGKLPSRQHIPPRGCAHCSNLLLHRPPMPGLPTWYRIIYAALHTCASQLDRSNLSFAALQMFQDLQWSKSVYGLGSGTTRIC